MCPPQRDRRDRDDERQLGRAEERRAPRGRAVEHAAVEQQRGHAAHEQEQREEQRQLQRAPPGLVTSASRSKAMPLATKKNGIRKP